MQNLNFPQQGNSLVRRLNETLLEDYFSLSNANVCAHLQVTEDISRGSAPAHSSCFTPRLRKIQNIQLLHKPLSRILITFPGAQPHGRALESWPGEATVLGSSREGPVRSLLSQKAATREVICSLRHFFLPVRIRGMVLAAFESFWGQTQTLIE